MSRIIRKNTCLISLLYILLFGTPALANVPVGAAIIINFPVIVYLSSFGAGLIAIVLIESLILKWNFQLTTICSIFLSLKINIFSSVLGALLTLGSSWGALFLLSMLIGAFLLSFFLFEIASKTDMLKKYPKLKLLIPANVAIISIATLFFCGVLMPYVFQGNEIIHTSLNTQLPSQFLTFLSMFSLIAIGFIATCISKCYYLVKFTEHKKGIISSTIKMNCLSYLSLIISTGYISYQMFTNV